MSVKNKKIEIEDLAVMIKHGFDAVDKRFEQVDKRLDRMVTKEELNNMHYDLSHRIEGLELRISSL